MAIKHTRKKNNYNKTKLANKLDKLASNVAKKGVFIVTKSNPGYKVINYMNKKIVIDNVPYLKMANEIADKINKSKEPVTFEAVNYKIERYYKHLNDIMFYKHTIRTSNDSFKVISTGSRLQESIFALREVKQNLTLI